MPETVLQKRRKHMSLTNMQYDAIIRSYQRRQLQNKREQNERIREIYTRYPRIKEIKDEIAAISLKITKTLLLDPDDEQVSQGRALIRELQEEKALLLQRAGLTKHDLELHYTCEDCQDTGYINNQKCHCFKMQEIELLYQQSNIRNQLRQENFQTFSFEYFRDDYRDSVTGLTPLENMRNIVRICQIYVAEFEKPEPKEYKNLLFFGETGVGKTFLTNCIAKELIEDYQSVIYLSAIGLFNILSAAEFQHDNVDAQHQMMELQSCDLLIIDDLGTELSNSFTNSALFHCLNERLLNHRSTIISTNLIFTELMERYSERITSRLAKEFTFLKIFGDDLRHNKKVKSGYNVEKHLTI